jgi:hypothetical protein
MSINNKNSQTSIEKATNVAQQAGLILMSAAVTFGMLEIAEQIKGRVIVPAQSSFVVEAAGPQAGHDEPIRREREETHPHSSSYSINQRTQARSGRM